jgi:hypothetical protein
MFLEEDLVTRSIRTRLRRAIGLGLALGVVIAPNALAKPYIGDFSGGTSPSTSQAANGTVVKTTTSNGYSFYRPAVASAVAAKHATYNGYSFYRPAPAPVSYYDAWHVPASVSPGVAAIGLTHDTWGGDIRASRVGVVPSVSSTFHDSWGSDSRTAITKQSTAINSSSSSDDTRNVLLAASAAGLLLIGGGSLVLMLRRRRAQLA